MDGPQNVLKRSLQFRLSLGLACVAALFAVIAGILSFSSAFEEAIELQDDQLRQVAALAHHQSSLGPSAWLDGVLTDDPESRLMILKEKVPDGWALLAEIREVPPDIADGFHTVVIANVRWRLFTETFNDNVRVAVGQQTAVRDEIAQNAALRTVAPLLLLILVLPLLAVSIVRTMLRPLKNMAADFEKRSEQDWQEIHADQMPSEVRPFVAAIRQLLGRVADSIAAQRRFLADAAHELRSPLTALSLQAERLDAADLSGEARDRLTTLRQGIARARALLDQLLALARAQGEVRETRPVSLNQIFRRILEDVLPVAEGKQIDIGLVTQDDIFVQASEVDLLLVLKNFIENAVRYTPAQGRVDIAATLAPEGAIVYVDDNGPGISPANRKRVFEPFYRELGHDTTGSGLGLSIVQTIAQRTGIEIALETAPTGGLRAIVTFPKAIFHPMTTPARPRQPVPADHQAN